VINPLVSNFRGVGAPCLWKRNVLPWSCCCDVNCGYIMSRYVLLVMICSAETIGTLTMFASKSLNTYIWTVAGKFYHFLRVCKTLHLPFLMVDSSREIKCGFLSCARTRCSQSTASPVVVRCPELLPLQTACTQHNGWPSLWI